jgi:uridine kinase
MAAIPQKRAARRTISPDGFVEEIILERRATAPRRAILVGVTGIDASGKGFVAARIAEAVERLGAHVALVGVDGFLNLPQVRFSLTNPGEHFYNNAVRFDELFGRLLEPLRRNRTIDVELDFADEQAASFRQHHYAYRNVDVVLVEGIYLLKQRFQQSYDLSCWVRCSFETAMARALLRHKRVCLPTQHARRTEPSTSRRSVCTSRATVPVQPRRSSWTIATRQRRQIVECHGSESRHSLSGYWGP